MYAYIARAHLAMRTAIVELTTASSSNWKDTLRNAGSAPAMGTVLVGIPEKRVGVMASGAQV